MKAKIYQVNLDRDTNRVAFEGFSRLKKLQGTFEIDSSIYDFVYDGNFDAHDLEDIFCILNVGHPKDYRGRSLSVSDIVWIYESDEVDEGFYYVDDFGFKEVDFEPSKAH